VSRVRRGLDAARRWWAAQRPLDLAGLAVGLLILGAGLCAYAATVSSLWGEIVIDDAFITYRYADNLARGLGPTWNLHDAPVEGYSTPLFVCLLAAGRWLTGVPVDVLGPWLCLLFGLLALLSFAWLCLRLTGSPAWSLAGTGFLAGQPSLAIWSMGGMETSLYVLLGLVVALALLRALTGPEPRAWTRLVIALFLLGETRTEGPYAAIAVAVLLLVERDPAWPRRALLQRAALLLAAFALCELFRLAYYHLPFPIPVYRKGVALQNAGQVLEFVAGSAALFGAYVVGLSLVEPGPARHLLKGMLLAVLLLLMIVINTSGEMSPFQRYLVAAVPLIYAGALVGLQRLSALRGGAWVAAAVLALVAVTHGRGAVGAARAEQLARARQYSSGVKGSHVALGQWLARAVHDPDVLVAAGDTGVVPYYAGLRFLDVEGLNDFHMATHGYDVDYVFAHHPELIVTRPADWDAPLLEDARLRRDYTRVKVFSGFYDLVVWRRNDFALADVP
jgi:arabinofuranosyltransferase